MGTYSIDPYYVAMVCEIGKKICEHVCPVCGDQARLIEGKYLDCVQNYVPAGVTESAAGNFIPARQKIGYYGPCDGSVPGPLQKFENTILRLMHGQDTLRGKTRTDLYVTGSVGKIRAMTDLVDDPEDQKLAYMTLLQIHIDRCYIDRNGAPRDTRVLSKEKYVRGIEIVASLARTIDKGLEYQ